MADNFRFAQLQNFSLAGAGAIVGATSIVLKSMNDIDGTPVVFATVFGAIGYGTLEPGSGDREEQISFTGITQNANGTATLTGVKNVSFTYPYTETAGLAKTHAGSTTFIISNTSGFYNKLTSKSDDETITGLWDFPSGANNPTIGAGVYAAPTLDTQIATKKYVDDVAVSGAPDANTTTKGIVQLPTQAQTDARTATGSTGASLTPTPANLRTVLTHDYAASAAGTDTYAITLSPVITAYTTGDVYRFKADVANTGACTLNVDGIGAKNIKVNGNLDPQNNYIKAGQIVEVMYDGTNMQVVSVSGKPSVSQTGEEIYAATATGNDTYVVTLAPVPSGYVAGMTIRMKVDVGNTGAATVNVNGLGAISIVKNVSTALETGDILANQVVILTYDGTNFQLQNTIPTSITNVIANSTPNTIVTANDYITYQIMPATNTANAITNGFVFSGMTISTNQGGGGYIVVTGSNGYIAAGLPGKGTDTILEFDSIGSNPISVKLRSKLQTPVGGIIHGIGLCDFGAPTILYATRTSTADRCIRFVAEEVGGVPKLYAVNSNGASTTVTDITSGVTITNWNNYEIIVTSTSILFYINGTLKATHTTNIPSTAGVPIGVGWGVTGNDAQYIGPAMISLPLT